MDTLLELASQRRPPSAEEEVSKAQAEDVVCVFSHLPSFRTHSVCLLSTLDVNACRDRSDAHAVKMAPQWQVSDVRAQHG